MRIRSGDTGQTAPMDDSHNVGRTSSDPVAGRTRTANERCGVIQQSANGNKGLDEWDITDKKGQYLRPSFYVPID